MRRRTLLLGGSALVLASCGDDTPQLPPTTVTPSRPTTNQPPAAVAVERVRSTARGRDVTLVVARPKDALDQELPVCVALHGRGNDARMILQLGVPKLLDAAVTPFAVVGVDGGNDYWVAKDPADDPQRMLTDELPGWLGERGLKQTPFAVFGLSMGAYGALNYARRTPHLVVATISPALFTSWPDAESRNAFADEAHWAATDPLQHVDALSDVALGVWCGTEDPFEPAARTLVAAAKPQVGKFAPGGHDGDYWQRTMPEIVTFLAQHVA